MAIARRIYISAIFNNEQGIVDVMNEFGIRQGGINRVVVNSFDSMYDLVLQYESDSNEFSAYLKSINKVLGNAAVVQEGFIFLHL